MSTESFVSSHVVDDDILVVKLHGRLETDTTSELEGEVSKYFEQGIRKVIIDCAHLGYISSLGVGALVRLQVKLRRQGGEIKLAAIQTMVSDVFRIVGLEKMLGIYGDTEFARESFYE